MQKMILKNLHSSLDTTLIGSTINSVNEIETMVSLQTIQAIHFLNCIIYYLCVYIKLFYTILHHSVCWAIT